MLYLGIFGLRAGQCAYWSYYNPNKFGLLQVLPYFIAFSFYFLPIKFGFKPLTNGIFLLVNFSSFRFLQKRRLLNNFRGPWGILFAVLWIGEIQYCSSGSARSGNSMLQFVDPDWRENVNCSVIKTTSKFVYCRETFFLFCNLFRVCFADNETT